MGTYLSGPEGDAETADDGASSSSRETNAEAPGASAERNLPGPRPTMPPDVPGRDPNRRGGWYYNYEEDRYSFCEDSDEEDYDKVDDELDVIVDLPDE